jgi:hypothetical protein
MEKSEPLTLRSLSIEGSRNFGFTPCAKIPFNVHHERTTIDDEGEELPYRHEAWRAARLAAGED